MTQKLTLASICWANAKFSGRGNPCAINEDSRATTGWFEGTRALWSNEWMISCTDNIPIYLQGDLSLEDLIDRLREDAFTLQAEYA